MAVKTQQQILEDLSAAKSYFGQLGTVVQGIVSGATGAAATATSSVTGMAGLVLVFAQFTITGIISAENAKKLKDVQIKWQSDKLKDTYAYNQLAEDYYKEQMLNDAEVYYTSQRSDSNKAAFIHALLAIGFVMLMMFLLYVLFPKKG